MNLFVRLVSFSHRHALPMFVAILIATLGLGYYAATHIGVNADTEEMLDASLPHRQRQAEFERVFPQLSNLLVVVIDGKDASLAAQAAQRLSARLREQPDLFLSVYQPGRGPFFERNGLLYLSEDELWALNDRLVEAGPWLGHLSSDASLVGLVGMLNGALSQEGLTESQGMALAALLARVDTVVQAEVEGRSESISWRELMVGDDSLIAAANREFVLVRPRLDFSNIEAAKDAMAALRKQAKALAVEMGASDVRIRITGSVAMADDELKSVSNGAELATLLSFAAVCLILGLGFRSARPVIAIIGTLLTGLVWTAAFAAWSVRDLNLISVSFAVLFIGLAVDFGIQFAMRFREELDLNGQLSDVFERTAAGVGGALSLAALAAAACFLGFTLTSYRGLAELGMISGAGMLIALVTNLTLLPALLTLMPQSPRIKMIKGAGFFPGWWRKSRDSHQTILIGALIVTVMASASLPFARFDFNPLNMKDPNAESVATFRDLLRDAEATPYTINILADDPESAEQLKHRLNNIGLVDKVLTLKSYVPDDQQTKLEIIQDLSLVLGPGFLAPPPASQHSNADKIAALAEFSKTLNGLAGNAELEMLAARLAGNLASVLKSSISEQSRINTLESGLISDLPEGLENLRELLKAKSFEIDDLPEDLRARYLSEDGHSRVEIFPRENLSDNDDLRRFVLAVGQQTSTASGTPINLLEGGDAVVRACLQASVYALIAIFIILLIALKSLSDALMVLAPLVLAALLTTASSVILGIPFDLANIIALPLLVGLGIAFGIYLVVRWRSAPELKDAMGSSTPRAIFFSALTTMASFGVLAFSDHRGMAGMGQLLTLSLTFALLCTLLVLPALLRFRELRSMAR